MIMSCSKTHYNLMITESLLIAKSTVDAPFRLGWFIAGSEYAANTDHPKAMEE